MLEDTIAAIITPLGISSVGAIRISGPDALTVADKVFKGKRNVKLAKKPTFTIAYGKIITEDSQILDEALALVMKKPHSFTSEDVVEIHSHGGPVVLQKTLELVIKAGARMAEPGEFSKRAFLNGRIDLAQAEAIMDVINAKTEKGLQAAVGNLSGNLTESVKELKAGIIDIMAYLEADIDYPEDDFDRLSQEELAQRIEETAEKVSLLLDSYKSGRIIKDGLKTALIGRPNVGKSSLLNALLKEKRALVTDIPGTTRDTIEEYYNMDGVPLVLIDTAGLRKTENLVEKLGVERTKEAIAGADLILYVLDITQGLTEEDRRILEGLNREKVLVIMNKTDLPAQKSEEEIRTSLTGCRLVFISAREGTGLKELKEAISAYVLKDIKLEPQQVILTNIRQKTALEKVREALLTAGHNAKTGLPADFITIDLRQALHHLQEVTGETLEEDIIDQIFARFCLGK